MATIRWLRAAAGLEEQGPPSTGAITPSAGLTGTAAGKPPPDVAVRLLSQLSLLVGLNLGSSTVVDDAKLRAASAPRIVAFTGKGQWNCLFDPPLK
jgi:hypothetical protein